MKRMEEVKEAVLDMLTHFPTGVSRETLEIAAWTDDRTVRRAIRELRRQHYPIGNAKEGYTFGANEGLRKTIADMRCKALDQLTTAAELEKCLTLDGQETIKGLSQTIRREKENGNTL